MLLHENGLGVVGGGMWTDGRSGLMISVLFVIRDGFFIELPIV